MNNAVLLGSDFAEEVMGFSFGKMFKKVIKATNPIRVTKNLAKATVRAIDPRTHLKIAKAIISNPLNIKRNIGKLAMLDPGINMSVKMFRDMKDKKKKPAATKKYYQIVAKAQAGDPEAKKQVGAIKQLAIAEQKAPQVPDSEMERGAEEIVKQAHDQNPQTFNKAFIQANKENPPEPAIVSRPQQAEPEYEEEYDEEEYDEEEEGDDEVEGDSSPRRFEKFDWKKYRERKKKLMQKARAETVLGGPIAKTLTSGKLNYKDIVRQSAGLDSMGFSFGDLVKSAVSVVKKVAPSAIAVAKLTPYGAAIDTALKVAGPALNAGAQMLRGAQQGNKADVAKVQQIKSLAKAGSKQGVAALKTLQQAKTLNNAVVQEARKVTQQPSAAVTMPSAVPGQAPVQVVVMMPDRAAAGELLNAAKGAGSRFFVPTSLYQQGAFGS